MDAQNGATTEEGAFALSRPLQAGAFNYTLNRDSDEDWYPPHSGCTKEYTIANRHNYPASSERYQLTDIDGEDAFIRIGSIAMVRVPPDVMEPVEEDDE